MVKPSSLFLCTAQTFTGEFDAAGVVDEAIEDRVGAGVVALDIPPELSSPAGARLSRRCKPIDQVKMPPYLAAIKFRRARRKRVAVVGVGKAHLFRRLR